MKHILPKKLIGITVLAVVIAFVTYSYKNGDDKIYE